MKSFLVFLMLAMTQPVIAQSGQQRPPTPPEVEVERMRIQAEQQRQRELDQQNWETKIFPVKHVEPTQLHQALRMFRAEIVAENNLRVLSVRAPKEIMPAIGDAIKMLDVPVPSKVVDLTIYLLLASDQAIPSAKPVPAVLQPVVTQLKSILAYSNFNLVDTLFSRGSDEKNVQVTGSMIPVDDRMRVNNYRLNSRLRIEKPEGKPPVVRFTSMQFTIEAIVTNQGTTNVSISTDVDVPAGQQVVVGKTTVGDRAFILVISAKFLD